jgi:hypothetical protein
MIKFYELTDASLHEHDPLHFVMSEFVSHELELRPPIFKPRRTKIIVQFVIWMGLAGFEITASLKTEAVGMITYTICMLPSS